MSRSCCFITWDTLIEREEERVNNEWQEAARGESDSRPTYHKLTLSFPCKSADYDEGQWREGQVGP